MDDGPTSDKDASSMRRTSSLPLSRTPSPFEILNGVKGALEGRLGRRESSDNLLARNILRAPPTTAGRVTAGAQELKWKQTQDSIGAHLKDKISNNKEPLTSNGVTPEGPSFQDRQDAVKQVLETRSPRTDLVQRGVIVEDEQTDPDSVSTTPILPRAVRRRSVPTTVPPVQSPIPTPSQSPATSPFLNVRRKRASSLILPGSRSTTPVPHDEDETSSASHGRITRNNYIHLLTTEARSVAHAFVSLQMAQNGMMIQRLEGEVGIPYICCTGGYVWVGYKGGSVIAFESLCMEPDEELRKEPVSSHSYIRALISVGTHVWCGHASGEIQIWDGSDGEHLNTISAHPGVGVSALFYAERSGQVWSGGGDGKLCVWNTAGKQCVRRMGQSHTGAVRIIAQIGNYIWTMADSASGAFLWGADQYNAPDNGTQPNGTTSFANSRSLRKSTLSPVPFSARSPTPPRRIKETHGDVEEVPASVVHLGPGVLCVLAVPHHEASNIMMWVGTSEGPIRVVDPETKEVVRTLNGHTSQVNVLVLVGAHIWSASNDKSIRIWNAKNMDLIRTISDAHTSAIYSLCLSGSHVWSGSTDRSVRVWLAAGVHELLGAFLESALQGIYDLEARQRKGEEKLAQSEAHAKQNAEEIASLRLKLKTQAGEAMNAKHEMELLAQEVASVDQWQRKMQALKAVYHSDKAVLKDKLAKAHDFIEQQDATMHDLKEKLRDTDAHAYRLHSERNGVETEARELALLLQKAEADSMVYATKLEQLERKEREDSELRRRMELKIRDSQENEVRLRQSVLLLEHNLAKSTQKYSSRQNSSLSGKVSNSRCRSSTIGGGEAVNFPLSSDLTEMHELGPVLARPHVPRLRLGNEANSMEDSKTRATIYVDDSARIGESEESTIRETEDEEEVAEYGREVDEEVEVTDVTVSLVDVLGMVKYKGERTTALQERIQKLSHKLQQMQHHQHIQQLQQLHEQQMMHRRGGEEETIDVKQSLGWWTLVFVVLVAGFGVILFMLRKNMYVSSMHPS